MSSSVLKALQFSLKQLCLYQDQSFLFVNAEYNQDLYNSYPINQSVQWLKGLYNIIDDAGFGVSSDFPEDKFDVVIVSGTKNLAETKWLIAQSYDALDIGGTFIFAADNNAGGKRFHKEFQPFNLEIESFSKHKCRVLSFIKNEPDVFHKWLSQDLRPSVSGTDYKTRIGVYGGSKVDRGSEILMEHIPVNLKGKGADLGAGYGYLSLEALRKCDDINEMDCYEHNFYACEAIKDNLRTKKDRFHVFWSDLSVYTPPFKGRTYDFIIMNPPFHTGKETDISLGQQFIRHAAFGLKNKGMLYMVANMHLPYEKELESLFTQLEILEQKNGFKVIRAIKW